MGVPEVKIPEKAKQYLHALCWVDKHDRFHLWRRIQKFVADPEHPDRCCITEKSNEADIAFEFFFHRVYVPEFSTKGYFERNPSLRMRANFDDYKNFERFHGKLRSALVYAASECHRAREPKQKKRPRADSSGSRSSSDQPIAKRLREKEANGYNIGSERTVLDNGNSHENAFGGNRPWSDRDVRRGRRPGYDQYRPSDYINNSTNYDWPRGVDAAPSSPRAHRRLLSYDDTGIDADDTLQQDLRRDLQEQNVQRSDTLQPPPNYNVEQKKRKGHRSTEREDGEVEETKNRQQVGIVNKEVSTTTASGILGMTDAMLPPTPPSISRTATVPPSPSMRIDKPLPPPDAPSGWKRKEVHTEFRIGNDPRPFKPTKTRERALQQVFDELALRLGVPVFKACCFTIALQDPPPGLTDEETIISVSRKDGSAAYAALEQMAYKAIACLFDAGDCQEDHTLVFVISDATPVLDLN